MSLTITTSTQKRITAKLKHPNPLFERWLTEWKDSAKMRDSKMQHCFEKALQSLRKYPLPLQSGRHCKILNGFGDKLCNMLDRKLAEYKAENGGVLPTPVLAVAEPEEVPNKSKRGRKPGNYVPILHSGAHAILETLYRKSLEPDYRGYLSKMDIIKFGQHICDKSFTRSESGTFYTAWSSMRTLINKNLVLKQSHPPKFSLTDEGIAVATKLCEATSAEEDDDLQMSFSINDAKISGSAAVQALNRCSFPEPVPSTSSNRDNLTSCFKNNLYSSAESTKSQISGTADLYSNSKTSGTSQKSDLYSSAKTFNSKTSTISQNTDLYSSSKTFESPGTSQKADLYSSAKTLESNSSKSQKTDLYSSSKTFESKTSGMSLQGDFYSSTKSIQTKTSGTSQETISSFSDQEQIIFSPFNFDVYLLVDSKEISGKVASASDDPMINELIHQSVPFEIRHLKVGDYTWICRDKTTQKELVLPYVVERKRMDDFGSSIKDGRFHEQKFRLKQTGLHNLIYLVESYGNNTHVGLPLGNLYQAATNTLVQDGFSVKFSENFKDTAQYLAFLTTILKNIFESKTLMGCRKSDVVNPSINDDFVFLMTFGEFNKSAAKNKVLKVQDLFVRQLLQLKGVSVDKALAIVNKYPTVKSLRDAYKSVPRGEGEKLLANLKFGNLNKNIGPRISKTLYDLYNLKTFP